MTRPAPRPIRSRASRDGVPGEYSTIVLPDQMVETMFFPDDTTIAPVTVGRTLLHSIATQHIQNDPASSR